MMAIVSNTTVQTSITIGATNTAPTVGTRTVQTIESQTIGDKLRLLYKFGQVTTSAGNGDYLLSLPTSKTFNTTKNPTFAGTLWTGGISGMAPYFIPAAGLLIVDSNSYNQLIVVPYDTSRFRLVISDPAGGYSFWSSVSDAFFTNPRNTGNGWNLQLTFEIWA